MGTFRVSVIFLKNCHESEDFLWATFLEVINETGEHFLKMLL